MITWSTPRSARACTHSRQSSTSPVMAWLWPRTREVGLIDGELRDELVPGLLTLGRYELDENSLFDIVEIAACVDAVLA